MSEEKEESKEERAKVLFERGQSSLEQNNFLEALHYFKLSHKLKFSPETEEKIKQCELKVAEIREKEKESEKQNESEAQTNEDDIECEKIISNNNYYEILGVTKEANNDEMKKAYKKLAIKFHPDKNRSSKAEEAFKKIATAYQTLTDPKKREIFDKYGSDEEYREKVYQERKREFEEEEEFDPYDVFDMFFRGVDPNEVLRRRRRFQRRQQNVNINPKVRKLLPFIQIIPLLLLGLNYYLPQLLEKKSLFVYSPSPEYPYERKTKHYKVTYYYGNDFNEKYQTKAEIKEVEKVIEDYYLEYLKNTCEEKKKAQEDLKYKLVYYRKGSIYYKAIEDQINKIDISVCDKYEKYLKKINRDKDILEEQ